MIVFDRVCKTYPGGVDAVRDLSLEGKEGEILVLLGTSGSGKTTAMKMINRLVEPTSGRIMVGDQDVREHDPISLRRKIGYAVQHVGLFPHMSVAENISVVPNLLQWSKEKVRFRTMEMLQMVGLEPGEFSARYPHQLSGGQNQRVGVARALAADPPIALMDEPFGALDPVTRDSLQDAFLQLQKLIKKTIIFVTHDVFEAVKLGDRIALLDEGRLQQLSTPANLVLKPENEFVKRFLGPQRFQLSIQVRTLEEVKGRLVKRDNGAQNEPGRDMRLSVGDSLASAMQAFENTGAEGLGVYDKETCLGQLSRKTLISAILGGGDPGK